MNRRVIVCSAEENQNLINGYISLINSNIFFRRNKKNSRFFIFNEKKNKFSTKRDRF